MRAAGLLTIRAGAPATLLIRGARVLDPATGLDGITDLLVRDGRIAAIGDGITASDEAEIVEADGLTLLPAFLDPHVHLRTPGQEHEEGIDSGTAAAAAGGFATILAMPNTDPVVDSASVMQSLHERAASEAVVAVGFLGAISLGQRGEQLAELGALADAGAVGYSDDGHPVERAGLLRRAFQYASITGRVLSLHCEELSLTRGSAMHEGAVSALLGIGGYPSIGESLMVARDLRIARYEGQPIHLCHLHVRESVDEVREARALGVDVSAEASPHHLLLTDDEVRSLDPNLRMSPPLAGELDRQSLIEALRDGTIDCVATDHAPHAPEEKDVPFEAAANGTTGLETAFPALCRGLVEPGLIELGTLVARMTSGPARAFGLEVPRIAVGEPANIALWDLDERYTVSDSDLRSRSHNNAFLGREVLGRCRLTVASGQIAHRHAAVPA
ncbi:MAG: dihydroorotase [Gaiellales bacterium]|nr:dihydroorotase [Gaiellales bacterium]